MKNRVFLFTFVIIVLLSSLLSGCSDSKDETFELRLAHFFPASHPAETILIKEWAEEISKATDGKVKIVSYPGETLLKATDTYSGIVDGVADIGLSCFSYTPGRFPVLEAFELPGIVYENSKSASMTAWEGIKRLDPKEVQDTKLLMVIATGPGDLFTKEPVDALEDMQGLEIRATGISAETIKALGGIAVGMPQSNTYEALSKGIVKGNLAPIEVLKGWKHAEVTKYITKTPFLYNTLFFITMNLDKWNSLPDNLKEKITDATEKYHNEKAIGLWDMQNEQAITYAVDEQKLQVIELSSEESAKWIEKVSTLQSDYMSKLKELGIETDPLEVIKELSEKYNEDY